LITFLIIFLGAAFGSFINVLIHRLPLKQSIVLPASHCPACKTPLKKYDNIPILSFILLGGKCRSCKVKISSRYVLVEILTAVSFLLLYILNDFTIKLDLLRDMTFFTFGIAIIFIDIQHFIIPDVLSLPLIAIGMVFAVFTDYPGWMSAFVGGGAGFLLFYLIALIYYRLKNEMGMGGGDIKYIAAVGTFVGISGLLFVLFLSAFLALLFHLFMGLLQRKIVDTRIEEVSTENQNKIVPFGPFITIAAFLFIIVGKGFVDLYFDLFR
jgi:leader peptidase (prepilin peptidase)/N-methyltransferase